MEILLLYRNNSLPPRIAFIDPKFPNSLAIYGDAITIVNPGEVRRHNQPRNIAIFFYWASVLYVKTS